MHTSPQAEAELVQGAALRDLGEALFHRSSPYAGDGLRNHNLRLYRLASALLAQRGLRLDDGLVFALAMVHDLGIVNTQLPGATYLERSLALLQLECAGRRLPEPRPGVVAQCLLLNHRLRRPPEIFEEAECFRDAVLIEHSRGLLRFGLPAAQVRAVFGELPRADLDAVLLDFAWRTLRREPRTLVRGVFF